AEVRDPQRAAVPVEREVNGPHAFGSHLPRTLRTRADGQGGLSERRHQLPGLGGGLALHESKPRPRLCAADAHYRFRAPSGDVLALRHGELPLEADTLRAPPSSLDSALARMASRECHATPIVSM